MVNTFLTPQTIAERSLATLYENLVMLPLVYTDWANFGTQAKGNTVNVRKPATFEALDFDRAVGIQPQDITEGQIPIVLNRIKDVSVVVTSEQQTLSIEDFGIQVLDPMMEAIAQSIDVSILDLRNDITQVAGTQQGFEWNKPEVLIEAGRQLDLRNVPPTDRLAVVGPTTRAQWLNTELLKFAEHSDSTAALRNASIGQNLFGFNTFMTQNVGQPASAPNVGAPTTEVGLAFHKTAFAFVSAPLAVPPGESNRVTAMAYKGLNLRVAYGYDMKYKQFVCSIDILFGTKTLDPNRAVLLKGANRAS
jgi:hypothetical protein